MKRAAIVLIAALTAACALAETSYVIARRSGKDGNAAWVQKDHPFATYSDLAVWAAFPTYRSTVLEDYSPTGVHSGALYTATGFGWSPAYGGCYAFPATAPSPARYIVLADKTTVAGATAMTVAMWINATDTGAGQRAAQQNATWQLQIRYDLAGNDCYAFVFDQTGTQKGGKITGADWATLAGRWSHAVMTANGTSNSVYFNGVLQGRVACAFTSISTADTTLTSIGSSTDGVTYANPFVGSIGSVKLLRKALSASEVLALYNHEKGGYNRKSATAAYVGAYNGKAPGATPYSWGLAYSTDGKQWQRFLRPMVSTLSWASTWGGARPCPLVVGGTQYMYFDALKSADSSFAIGRATSTDWLTWTQEAGNPLMSKTGAGWEKDGVYVPIVVYDAGAAAASKWKMIYTGISGTTHQGGYAYSSNGLAWTRGAANPIIPTNSPNATLGAVPCGVYQEGGTNYVYYSGRRDSTAPYNPYHTTCVAYSTDWTNWTQYAGNPVLVGRTNAVDTLGANVASGATTITVPASSSRYKVGDVVVLDDLNSESSWCRVTAIPSDTQLTIAPAAQADYTTAQTAKIISIHSISKDINSVHKEGSVYVAYVNNYNLFTFNSTRLWEHVTRYTASSPFGPWTEDTYSGIMGWPRQWSRRDDTGWDYGSCENLKVVATNVTLNLTGQ